MNNCQKYFLYSSLSVIGLMTLISLGIVGKETTYRMDLFTTLEKETIQEKYSAYYDSTNGIMAWNVFLILYMPLYIYGAFNFTDKCFKIMSVFYFIAFWLPRWVVCLVFLQGQNDLKNVKYEQYNNLQDKCEINLIQCVTSSSYINAIRVETAYGILFFMLGLPLMWVCYKINQLRNESAEKSNEHDKNEDEGGN